MTKYPIVRWRSPAGIALLVFLGIIAFFLIAEHLAHIIPILPWFFLLLCPLMHLFMHSGHGGHNQHETHSNHNSDSSERKS